MATRPEATIFDKALDFARIVLQQIRQVRWIHAPVHAVAVVLARTEFGARLIRSVISPQYPSASSYQDWVQANDTLNKEDLAAIAAHMAAFSHRPTFSVVMPAYNTPVSLLQAAMESVRAQIYPDWELCIADDASPEPEVWKVLARAAAGDKRIKVVRRPVNGHISAASNSALELATGDFVVLMDHDDLLPTHALYEVAALLQDAPEADIIYSDEDKVDEDGVRFEAYFKTGWNPELLLSQNYISHLGVFRRRLITEIGGFREGFEGSQDYDLVLRASERTSADRIRHIPKVLYHWRQQTRQGSFSETELERCGDAAMRAVGEHLARCGQTNASVGRLADAPAWVDVQWSAPKPEPLVSIIIPTRDRADMLEACLDGVLNNTDYPAIEVIIADNDSAEAATFELFSRVTLDPRVRVIQAPGPFNYSDINNRAVRGARGGILLFLNNDIVVQHPEWLSAMVGHAIRPEVGAVGAKLYYADGRVQHGGVILGVGGEPPVAGNLYAGAPPGDAGYYNHLGLARNLSAVTAACMAVRRAVFDEVGGFNADDLKVAFNDVDLCLRIGQAGYQIIWTPKAELIHLESASRGSDLRPQQIERFQSEIAYMRDKWGPLLDNDPFYGPNFDHLAGDYRLAPTPRRRKTWAR